MLLKSSHPYLFYVQGIVVDVSSKTIYIIINSWVEGILNIFN